MTNFSKGSNRTYLIQVTDKATGNPEPLSDWDNIHVILCDVKEITNFKDYSITAGNLSIHDSTNGWLKLIINEADIAAIPETLRVHYVTKLIKADADYTTGNDVKAIDPIYLFTVQKFPGHGINE